MALAGVRFVPDPVQMRQVPLQASLRLVRRTAAQVETGAKVMAPVNNSPRRQPGPHLRDSIRTRIRTRGSTLVIGRVGSTLRHALVAHQGAAPHPILARRAPNLKFFWEKRGVTFVGPKVNHPGMKGTPYLAAPLLAFGRANGFIVVLVPTPD